MVKIYVSIWIFRKHARNNCERESRFTEKFDSPKTSINRKIRLTDISIQGHFKIYPYNYLITDVLADDDIAFSTALDKLTDDFDSFI